MNLTAIDDIMAEGLAEPVLTDLSVAELWARREELRYQAHELSARRGSVEAEMLRRIQASRPDWTEESSGSASVVGDGIEVKGTWSREYEYDAALLVEAQKHLTEEEHGNLVSWMPKVSGTAFNALIKRGGELGDLLARARKMKRASVSFEAKERK